MIVYFYKLNDQVALTWINWGPNNWLVSKLEDQIAIQEIHILFTRRGI